MREYNSLIGQFIISVKEHSRVFGVAGAVVGAILVIYYCSSIDFYPSGLTISDTLFFLWAVIVFGFYYSVVAFAFFIASSFWVALLARPINFLLKRSANKRDIVVPLPKSDLFLILGGGFLANVLILSVTYLQEYSFILVVGALFLIGLIYTLLDNTSKKDLGGTDLLDSTGRPIYTKPMSIKAVKLLFIFMIYGAPLLFAQVGGGVTRTTFATMGILQVGVNISIDSKGYKTIIEDFKEKGLASNVECSDVCTFQNITILFTNIGSNTKIQVNGPKGSATLVFPSTAIKLVAKINLNG